jgi:hypothetical protein
MLHTRAASAGTSFFHFSKSIRFAAIKELGDMLTHNFPNDSLSIATKHGISCSQFHNLAICHIGDSHMATQYGHEFITLFFRAFESAFGAFSNANSSRIRQNINLSRCRWGPCVNDIVGGRISEWLVFELANVHTRNIQAHRWQSRSGGIIVGHVWMYFDTQSDKQCSDVNVVKGQSTGSPPRLSRLQAVQLVCQQLPVWINA